MRRNAPSRSRIIFTWLVLTSILIAAVAAFSWVVLQASHCSFWLTFFGLLK